MRKLSFFILCLLVIAFLTGCSESNVPTSNNQQSSAGLSKTAGDQYVLHAIEYITDAASGKAGQTIYTNDRSKQLGAHWVPGDPRRGGHTSITYIIDQGEGAATPGLSNAQTEAAIDRAMNTWDNVGCSTLPLQKLPYPGGDLGYVEAVFGFGGLYGWYADITHGGWLPGAFYDLLEPDGSNFILGVTFTLIWVDVDGNPTDIDGNGKADVAFREIYYNDQFPWAIDANFDVESIALHEMGHGLSQGHFGKIFRTSKNGKLHFAPKAVMNAAYTGVQQSLSGSDKGGHCSIWGSWPNN